MDTGTQNEFTQENYFDLADCLSKILDLNFEKIEPHLMMLEFMATEYIKSNITSSTEIIQAVCYFNNLVRVTKTYENVINKGSIIFESMAVAMENEPLQS